MAETTEFVSRIKVRDLISTFESKNSSDRTEFFRPRAKSVGNVLAKNVIVQISEFTSLDDIENALRKIDTNLNFYEVYNKAKHVAFQEQLFNILTSIVNIESEAEDAAARRKRLISKTQTLVSFLNQKLPSNASTVIAPDSNQYKYVPYASYVKENGTTDVKSKNAVGDTSKHKAAPHSESTKNISISEWSEAHFVSVKKLKENFLPKSESTSETPPKSKTDAKNENSSKTLITNGFQLEQPKDKQLKVENIIDEEPLADRQQMENVSVSKLRNMFEKKSEETPKGLEIVTGVKKEADKSLLGGSATSVNFPYTERNLGNLRLQRSVSGSYMNYSGLLNRIDLNRTNSVNDINNIDQQNSGKFANNIQYANEDSGSESDTEDEEKQDDFDKYSDNSSTDSLDDLEQKPIHTVQEMIAAFENAEEIDVNYSTAKAKDVSRNENSAIVAETEKFHANSSAAAPDTKLDDVSKQTLANNVDKVNHSTEERSNILDNGNIGHKGIEGIYVNYSTDWLDDVNHDPNSTNKNHVATGKGVEEIEVNYSTAHSQNILENKQTANLQGVDTSEVIYSNVTSDTTNHEVQKAETQGDSQNFSGNGINNLENRKITTIDEEIDKIHVDPALANEDIILNPEDLKNADDEFEKLLESSEAEKIIT